MYLPTRLEFTGLSWKMQAFPRVPELLEYINSSTLKVLAQMQGQQNQRG